ncbi:unnamed protein product [Urochloa decumbens]|uniref:Uncharacterized protein n=1 Tax=Urochloa decumbens TaxID=240449 RepID=A0ABC8ZC13_9POAL
MAAMTESAHTYGHYVPLQGEAQSDNNDSSTGNELINLAQIFAIAVLMLGFLYIMSYYLVPVDPQISVQITGAAGLDDLHRPAVSPFFNLTIHVDNGPSRQQACRPNSAVTMYSGDDSIAWGKLPAFCVEKRSKVDLDVSLSSRRTILSRALRNKMASDGLQLSVEMKPINPEPSSEACLFVCNDVAPEPTACTQCCFWPYKKGTT